jgi:hypothetical protein
MEQNTDEPITTLSTINPYATRHDGWTGEKMAIFCEALAETAVVAEACEVARMGISGAYAARRRNPVFAAAWDAALTMARERLADTLLARSMEGNIEQIYKDGELIGERHVLDNRLGLAILKRLDKMAEREFPCAGRGPAQQERTLGPCLGSHQSTTLMGAVRRGTTTFDWATAIDALRTGDDEGVAHALALIEGDKVEEVEGYPLLSGEAGSEPEEIDLSDRCWIDDIDHLWMTDFPPPAGFTGYESRPYDEVEDDERYVRVCTDEEIAILKADVARARDAERAEQEALRDEWFALVKAEAEAA